MAVSVRQQCGQRFGCQCHPRTLIPLRCVRLPIDIWLCNTEESNCIFLNSLPRSIQSRQGTTFVACPIHRCAANGRRATNGSPDVAAETLAVRSIDCAAVSRTCRGRLASQYFSRPMHIDTRNLESRVYQIRWPSGAHAAKSTRRWRCSCPQSDGI